MSADAAAPAAPTNGPSVGPAREGPVAYALSYVWWPLLMAVCIAITAAGMAVDQAVLAFNGAYILLGVSLYVLERRFPWSRDWLKPDGQTFANIAHTLISKGTVQVLVIFAGTMGLAGALAAGPSGIWPGDWPLWAQAALGMVIAEFGLYWAHRLAHEVTWLWPFHAVHHSVTRLWFVNTGRFHVVDTVLSILLSQPLLYLAGAPYEVFLWVGAITAFSGLLTHTNTVMRCGVLNYVFNTPELHRWHHRPNKHEGNSNYGEVLMIWDLVFRSWYLPAHPASEVIGIKETMPRTVLDQIAYPFVTIARRLMRRRVSQ